MRLEWHNKSKDKHFLLDLKWWPTLGVIFSLLLVFFTEATLRDLLIFALVWGIFAIVPWFGKMISGDL